MRYLLAPIAVFAILATPSIVHADTLKTFDLNGTLGYNYSHDGYTAGEPGGSVTGTVVIDTTTGVFVSENVTYTGTDTHDYTYSGAAQTTFHDYQGNGFTYEIFGTNAYAPGGAYLQINTLSLVGYDGGLLCTLADTCPGGNASNLIESNSDVPNIASGSLTLAPTPEPSSLMLLGTGILSAAGVARRRFRKA